ncbi:undecaprenyl-diphosphate phosphatase [Silvibacterium dinghuense]|uniref:Undecaprenyl-diphosphatase n=1 Tax=Silvibacterium dinghuense TaxID=1560006 RepID=A0A4Q1SC22_9BACT|nr:undecaprenyl-diphosphate phosphatase [Silvibacterium dinghuense]RXS94380.1 undecaprenyl-diphosphate phosphatase [Silvibacterium dinghuense]GGH16483.1 undecaprenyl-diphosphatase [Silvibacterium dinghuense]
MPIFKVIILAIVQGLAELLPVSSSAHVVVAEKLMGLDPSSPQMTLLLVMLHTGTMFAVIVYFWKQWMQAYFDTAEHFKKILGRVIVATLLTGVIGEAIIKVLEKTVFKATPHAEIEDLFSHLEIVAPALAAAGILILIAGIARRNSSHSALTSTPEVTMGQAGVIGAVQGLCLPFRGFSRSGATISAGMLAGAARARAEVFSFALAVVLTPPVVAREALRLKHAGAGAMSGSPVAMSLLGMVFAFLAGLVALKWLSQWLESGRWYLFGIYCLVASVVVFLLHQHGY